MLIADEVGLGKTIEAGLVWTELDARRQADRVLVVCPSGLVDKWHQEMSERFGFETERLDSALLDELLEQFESDRVPARFRAVCSLERATHLGRFGPAERPRSSLRSDHRGRGARFAEPRDP